MRRRPQPSTTNADRPTITSRRRRGTARPPTRTTSAGELHLAALYRDGGKGFPRDMAQAAAWYRKAAEQGDVTAQGTLGVLYSMGQGVPQSDVEAYFWLDLAAAVKGPNQEQYAANRQMIGEHITADELSDVRGSRGQMEGRASATRRRRMNCESAPA